MAIGAGGIVAGIRAVTGGGGLLGLGLFKGLGKVNSTPQQDWDRAVAEGSVAKYFPSGPPPGIVVGPGGIVGSVPVTPPVTYVPPAQQAALPISYTGTGLMMAGGGGGGGALTPLSPWTTGGSLVGTPLGGLAGKSLKSALPVLNSSIARASGLVLSGGVWWQGPTPVGRARRRRRINPLNYRAALRAARRLGLVQDLITRIERALPRARVRKVRFGTSKKRR